MPITAEELVNLRKQVSKEYFGLGHKAGMYQQLHDMHPRLPGFFAAPSVPYCSWPRFLIKRGRIASNPALRRGGVWQIFKTLDGPKIYVVCPVRRCKNLLLIDLYAEQNFSVVGMDGGYGYHKGHCVVCNRCEIHMWFIFDGWNKHDKLPMASER